MGDEDELSDLSESESEPVREPTTRGQRKSKSVPRATATATTRKSRSMAISIQVAQEEEELSELSELEPDTAPITAPPSRKRRKTNFENSRPSTRAQVAAAAPVPKQRAKPSREKPCALLTAARHAALRVGGRPNPRAGITAFGEKLPEVLQDDDAYEFELPVFVTSKGDPTGELSQDEEMDVEEEEEDE
ncbi:hypothetical protein C8R47DRAFT_288938 [Mycena vitilis]|nr:hypothetical protein C8R47DRAFT_288938 [Mycena vitilis]